MGVTLSCTTSLNSIVSLKGILHANVILSKDKPNKPLIEDEPTEVVMC